MNFLVLVNGSSLIFFEGLMFKTGGPLILFLLIFVIWAPSILFRSVGIRAFFLGFKVGGKGGEQVRGFSTFTLLMTSCYASRLLQGWKLIWSKVINFIGIVPCGGAYLGVRWGSFLPHIRLAFRSFFQVFSSLECDKGEVWQKVRSMENVISIKGWETQLAKKYSMWSKYLLHVYIFILKQWLWAWKQFNLGCFLEVLMKSL